METENRRKEEEKDRQTDMHIRSKKISSVERNEREFSIESEENDKEWVIPAKLRATCWR